MICNRVSELKHDDDGVRLALSELSCLLEIPYSNPFSLLSRGEAERLVLVWHYEHKLFAVDVAYTCRIFAVACDKPVGAGLEASANCRRGHGRAAPGRPAICYHHQIANCLRGAPRLGTTVGCPAGRAAAVWPVARGVSAQEHAF